MSFNPVDWLTSVITTERILLGVTALVILVVTLVIDRVIRKAIGRYSQKISLDKNIENGFKLISRVLVVAAGAVAILQLFGIESGQWLISVSALGGAAIGFASTQTVGNFLAGIYLMVSRPFLVNDYVRIGDNEGEVREINVNYTKLYTPTFNVIEIPNRQVLESTIVNYSKGDVIDWTFTIGFSHDVPHQELVSKCIIPALDAFYEKYRDLLPRKPEYGLCGMDRLGRQFSIRIFFPEQKMDTFYNLQPEIMGDIVNRWDILRRRWGSH
ncbi:MAG: mechanosensitive ion channel family protein [Candidatus Bathyarchaeia archaeon]